jgi:hypothetical protein
MEAWAVAIACASAPPAGVATGSSAWRRTRASARRLRLRIAVRLVPITAAALVPGAHQRGPIEKRRVAVVRPTSRTNGGEARSEPQQIVRVT